MQEQTLQTILGISYFKGARGKMRKKGLFISAFLLIIGFAYILFSANQYTIADEENEIYASLLEWQNKASDFEFEMVILGITQIDQTSAHIVLFETSANNVGYAHLIKGWNGKYKIIGSGWGDNVVTYSDIQTDQGIYGILVGKNTDLEIDHIRALTVDGDYEFTSSVTGAETFVRYHKMPSNLEETFVSDLTFFDKNGEVLNPMRKEI